MDLPHPHLSGQVPDLSTRADPKVFWFFSSEKNTLPSEFVGRNPGTDAVRGISIILVLLHHTALRIPLMKTGLAVFLPKPLLQGLSWDGPEAVYVFFVVSGFLITQTSIARWGRLAALDLRGFYARRFARIAPCLFVLVAVLSVLDLVGVANYTITRADQSLPRAILAAIGLHLNWYEGHTWYLPGGWDVLWSLSIEEVFYLGFPVACLVLGRSRLVFRVAAGVLALSLPFALNALARAPEVWREKAYLPGMAAIAMGVCAALVCAGVWPARRPVVAACLGWSAALLLGAIFWAEDGFFDLIDNATMLLLTSAVAVLMVAFAWGWGQRAAGRGTAWLRSFGRMSYEIYLTHMFVVFPVIYLFHLSGGNLRLGWVWYGPVLGFSWCAGFATGCLLSRPADRWLREKLGAAPAPKVAVGLPAG